MISLFRVWPPAPSRGLRFRCRFFGRRGRGGACSDRASSGLSSRTASKSRSMQRSDVGTSQTGLPWCALRCHSGPLWRGQCAGTKPAAKLDQGGATLEDLTERSGLLLRGHARPRARSWEACQRRCVALTMAGAGQGLATGTLDIGCHAFPGICPRTGADRGHRQGRGGYANPCHQGHRRPGKSGRPQSPGCARSNFLDFSFLDDVEVIADNTT